MGPYAEAAVRLLNAGFLPIPSRRKHPAVPHKPVGGSAPRWRRDMVLNNLEEFEKCKDLGILCDQGVFVVDFDDVGVYESWREGGFAAEFDGTVLAKTRKGFHVWFKRTPLCDDLGLNDGPVGTFVDTDGVKKKKPMDIKTVTSSSSTVVAMDGSTSQYWTPGFCAVHPSPNKEWIRSPFDHEMKPISEALARRLHSERFENAPARQQQGAASADTRPAKRPRPASGPVRPVSASQTFWRPCALDVPCLEALGFPAGKLLSAFEYETMNEHTRSAGYIGGTYQFQLEKGVACPLCLKQEGHDNSYWVGHKPDGTRRVKSTGPSCFPSYWRNGKRYPGKFPGGVALPWSSKGLKAWLDAMRETGVLAPQALMSHFTTTYQHFANPRGGFVCDHRKLVFECDEGVAVVLFGARDAAYGYALAGLSDTPWIEPIPGMWPIPVPAELLFQSL